MQRWPLSVTLKREQLLHEANVARKRCGDILRDAVFEPNSIVLKKFDRPRKRGRLRTTWTSAVLDPAVEVAGSLQHLAQLWANAPGADKAWTAAFNSYHASC